MKDFRQILDTVNREIDSKIIAIKPKPNELYEPVRYVISLGGKRLRPALVLMACDLFGGNVENALPAALAVEVFHNFTLLHDDIMDNSPVRRGNPTVHEKWDNNTAILSGDVMSIQAYEYLSHCEGKHLKSVLDIFNDTAIKVCEGQQFDMNFENTLDVGEDDYLKMIELKTSVLLAGSLKIGAVLGNADESDAQKLYEFGRNIGLAFQLQDDYLDVFGDPEKFGKRIGNDILANKKTFLLIKTLELASGNDKKILLKQLDFNPETETEKLSKIKTVTQLYTKLGVHSISRKRIEEYTLKGMKYLNETSPVQDRKTELELLVKKLISRES